MSRARFIVGDTRQVLAQLADEGVVVDLVLTSPPFLALRNYLPDDDPAKGHEIGSERTPGAFLDVLLDVVDGCGRILAPHGSIAVDWWDTVQVVLDELMRQARSIGDPITAKTLARDLRSSGLLEWGDAFYQSTEPYKGAHYATWPRHLCVRPILSMCPERVCTTCGEPSRRIVEAEPSPYTGGERERDRQERGRKPLTTPANGQTHIGVERKARTVGWTDCGHDTWRPGIVLDPFAGSGSTLLVATGHARDAIGIDLDARNVDLARERLGMFLEVA